jgi:hypothetical protein
LCVSFSRTIPDASVQKYEETLKLLEEMRVEGVYPTKDIVSDLITAADEVGGADRVLVYASLFLSLHNVQLWLSHIRFFAFTFRLCCGGISRSVPVCGRLSGSWRRSRPSWRRS